MTKVISLEPKKVMNRSTIWEYLRNDTDLEMKFTKIGSGSYPVMAVPLMWDESYLLINSMRFTEFQSIILFSNELVVRYCIYGDMQVNIPYRDIEYIEVREDMDIGYMALHKGKKIKR